MQDRFAEPPPQARRLVELMRLKTELRRFRVLGIEARAKSVTLHLRDDTPLDPVKIGNLVGKKRSRYRLCPDGRLTLRPPKKACFPDGLATLHHLLLARKRT
jgi:transcription-repair coupling factor (superfamily II helicase)